MSLSQVAEDRPGRDGLWSARNRNLTVGLVLYLSGLVLKSPEGTGTMVILASGVVIVCIVGTLIWTRVVGTKVKEQARKAEKDGNEDELPEQ